MSTSSSSLYHLPALFSHRRFLVSFLLRPARRLQLPGKRLSPLKPLSLVLAVQSGRQKVDASTQQNDGEIEGIEGKRLSEICEVEREVGVCRGNTRLGKGGFQSVGRTRKSRQQSPTCRRLAPFISLSRVSFR